MEINDDCHSLIGFLFMRYIKHIVLDYVKEVDSPTDPVFPAPRRTGSVVGRVLAWRLVLMLIAN